MDLYTSEQIIFYVALSILFIFMYAWSDSIAKSTGTRSMVRSSCVFFLATVASELGWTFFEKYTDPSVPAIRVFYFAIVGFNIVSFTIAILLWLSYAFVKMRVPQVQSRWLPYAAAIPLAVWVIITASSPATGLIYYLKDGLIYDGRFYKLHILFEVYYLAVGFFVAGRVYLNKEASHELRQDSKLVLLSGVPFIISEIFGSFLKGTSLPTVCMFLSISILYFARIGEYASVDYSTGLLKRNTFKRKWRKLNRAIEQGEQPHLYALRLDTKPGMSLGAHIEETDQAMKILAGAIRTYLVTSEGTACLYRSDTCLIYINDAGNAPRKVIASFENIFDVIKTFRKDIGEIDLYVGYAAVTRELSYKDAVNAALSFMYADTRAKHDYSRMFSPDQFSHGFYYTVSNLENCNASDMLLHDNITGLYNQDGFMQKLRKMMNATESSYIMIQYDVRNFRLFSTIYQEQNASRIVLDIGQCMKELENEIPGAITCHLHNDRFLFAVPEKEYSEADLKLRMEKIMKLFSDKGFRLKLQAGICFVNEPDIKLNTYINRTDLALKSTNDDDYRMFSYYDDKLMNTILNRETIIRNFPKAVENKEFHTFLQPQVNADGTLAGAEALVRWIDSSGTIISPATFIPVLEDNNIVYKLDKEIWSQAAEILSTWKNKNLTISVNLSTKDIFYIDVPGFIDELQKKYDFENRLKIEITETSMITDMDRFIELVNTLHNKGIQVEIDDFGSGYSSLNMLKDIRADVLKIDMNFLSVTDERSFTVIRNVISMAHELNMTVICEGVERLDEAEALRRMNCDMFQGYYYSKPIPLEEFNEKYSKEINNA